LVLMIIKTRNLTKKVSSEEGELIILNDINLELEKGKSLAVVGPSGSGKSTLLGLLAGLDSPTSGEVFLNNRPLHELNEDQRAKVRKENVAFVFQSFELLPGLTALENVMLPSELNRDKDAETRASEYLTRVGLGKRLKHYPRQLSGGEQQRVAIARAFADLGSLSKRASSPKKSPSSSSANTCSFPDLVPMVIFMVPFIMIYIPSPGARFLNTKSPLAYVL